MELIVWAAIAFAVSVAAGALGWTGVAGTARTVARWLFGIFLVLAFVIIAIILLGIEIAS